MGPKVSTNRSDSSTSPDTQPSAQPSGWFLMGAVAAASVLAGGLAAAWWYRKTLSKLHQANEDVPNPDSWISPGGPTDEA